MRLRHYSLHTERSYWDWIRRYVKFHAMKSRADLCPGQRKGGSVLKRPGSQWPRGGVHGRGVRLEWRLDKTQNFLAQRLALTGLGAVSEENTPGDLLHLSDCVVESALVGNGLSQGVELGLR